MAGSPCGVTKCVCGGACSLVMHLRRTSGIINLLKLPHSATTISAIYSAGSARHAGR